MRKPTAPGLAEHAPRDKGKEGRFYEAVVLGKFSLNLVC
jgi:hypothetical protein